MRTLRPQYPLHLLCRVLEVSRSGYYAWRNRRPSKRAQENARLEVAIQAAHVRTRQTYGPERLQTELRDDGFPAGIGRIKRLRKKLGLRCTQVRRFTTTTESKHALPVAENVLAQTFIATRPNETWVTDITYVPTAEGWLYLAGIKDLFTCEVVGHAMGARMTTALVSQALGAAGAGERARRVMPSSEANATRPCATTGGTASRASTGAASVAANRAARPIRARRSIVVFGCLSM